MDIPSLFSRITLVTKISLGFSTIALLFVLNIVSNYFDADQANQGFEAMVSESLPILERSVDVELAIIELESSVLRLMESGSESDFNSSTNRLNNELNGIRNKLDEASKIDLSEDLSNRYAPLLLSLSDAFEALAAHITTIETTQLQRIKTDLKALEITQSLNVQQSELQPLIDDAVYELSDDELIAQLFEVAASLNKGMWTIEKIIAVEDIDTANALALEIQRWLTNHTSMFPYLLNSDAGDEYNSFITKLGQVTQDIIGEVMGEEGLNALKKDQIIQRTEQQNVLKAFLSILDEVVLISSELNNVAKSSANQLSTENSEKMVAQQKLGLGSGFITLVFVVFISIYLTSYFKKSIRAVQKKMNSLAHGELDKPENITRADEFGRLSQSLNTVLSALREIVSDIGQASMSIEDEGKQVSGYSEKTKDYVEKQKTELDTVATALTEMNATSHEVAKYAEDTHTKVAEASALAQEGQAKVEASMRSVQNVSKQSSEATKAIQDLDEGVKGIESILTTIGSIADQTNLLALNAAIEAARAGEQGRGFAVVADEVRALAARTQESTREIQEMTEKMIQESSKAVNVIELSSNMVAESVEHTQNTVEAIKKFDAIMVDVEQLSQLIATASEEQAATVGELDKNVHQISDLAGHTWDSAQVSQSSSITLNEFAQKLKENIKRFRVN